MASRSPVPFGARGLRGVDPFVELHREMNRLFDDFLGGGSLLPAPGQASGAMAGAPRLEVRESENEMCVIAELPGVKPEAVDLRLEGDLLTIAGEKKSERERDRDSVHVMERSFGRFRRSVQLPFTPDPDQVRAEFEHGVLTVRMPRQAQAQRARRIEVRAGGDPAPRMAAADAPQRMGDDGGASGQADAAASGARGGTGKPSPGGGDDGAGGMGSLPA